MHVCIHAIGDRYAKHWLHVDVSSTLFIANNSLENFNRSYFIFNFGMWCRVFFVCLFRANDALLTVFENVVKKNGPKDRRFRIGRNSVYHCFLFFSTFSLSPLPLLISRFPSFFTLFLSHFHSPEHAQQVQARDTVRFSRSNIIASMQPYHLLDDGIWAEKVRATY